MCNTMDWSEVLLVVIGAVLGFALSIITTIVNKAMDRHGKLLLFYKLVYRKETEKKAGIYVNDGYTYLSIPLYFEFQNTSNTARVIRDVCLYLYRDGVQIAKMIQLQYVKGTKRKDGEVTEKSILNFGGDKNSYSFVLPPLSIQKQECEFLYKVPSNEISEHPFDEIRFSYHDEKNKIMESIFCSAKQGWAGIDFDYKNEYIELKCMKKKGK